MSVDRFACLDCGTDTAAAGEYYALKRTVWLEANPACVGMLCLACCESRLGRTLTRRDFEPHVHVNQHGLFGRPRSQRMLERLTS